jgi:hypothetical protein
MRAAHEMPARPNNSPTKMREEHRRVLYLGTDLTPKLAANQGTKSSFPNERRNFQDAADVCASFFGSTKDR